MKYKMTTFFLFFLMTSNAFALLDFKKGIYEVEGKLIVKSKNELFISINYQSNSETRVKLIGKVPKELYEQGGSNVLVKFQIVKPFSSFLGEGQFLELKRYLNPFEEVRVYHEL